MTCTAYLCDNEPHTTVYARRRRFAVCRDHERVVADGKAITLWDGEFWSGYAPGVVTCDASTKGQTQ